MELKSHLNKHYEFVTKFAGGIEDNIDSHTDNVRIFNEKIISTLQNDIKGLNLIVLYDNTKNSDRYKNRVFDFYLTCDLDQVADPFKMSQVQNIAKNLFIIMKGIN